MKKNYYFLYYFFDNPYVRWIRVLIFTSIGIVVYSNVNNVDFVLRLLPFYFFLILQELFIHFGLENKHPDKKVKDNFQHIIECVDFKTRANLERHQDLLRVKNELLKEHEVKFFNRLLDVNLEISSIEFSEEVLLDKAREVVQKVEGLYVHGVDIYTAFLLLSDVNQKVLLNAGFDEKDVLTVLSWVRKKANLDGKKHVGIHFSGSGVFDFFVYGWSAELAKYATNFSQEVLRSAQVMPIGREKEYDLLITSLSKNSSSNALLVGPAGVGKTALVTQFVLDSDRSNLPGHLSNKLVFKLFAERLLAGVENQGELEERFISLFSELSHAGNIIVYIPNIENIFGGGGINIDISGVLVEYLKSNKIKIIGSTTPQAYQQFLYHKHEIKELFDHIDIVEPDNDTAVFMVMEEASLREGLNNIKISYQAIKEVCLLSDSYQNDGTALPGRAVHLLDDVIAHAHTHGIKKVTKKEVQDFIQEKVNIVLDEPTTEESQKLLNLESELHHQVIAQEEAIQAVSDAMRRVRTGIADEKKPIASFLFLGPTGVGKTETAKALAKAYFGDEEAMIRLDMSEYQNPNSIERFLGGQSNQEEILTDKILKRPFTILLLDEFEKAYPPILDLFLQILDEGHLTDNLGRTVSFRNTIIIATSNAGSEFIREEYKEGVNKEEFKTKLMEKVMSMGIYKPELLNRFDEIVVFRSLTEQEVVEVSKLFLQTLIDKIAEKHIILTYDIGVAEYIAQNAYSHEFGARNIARFIEQSVENQLSKLMLSHELQSGSEAKITVQNGSLVIAK